MRTLTHIDCFSGPGGICTGFKAAGIKTVLAIEKVESCVDTYSRNHPEVKIIHKDIRDVTPEDVLSEIPNEIDIITSGMPCETFSTAGSKSRSFFDHRQQLYSQAIRIAKMVNPRLILFENVPGILSKKVVKGEDRLIIEDILDELSDNGYKYYIKTLINTNDFGIPQNRDRFFLLATREENLDLKEPISKHNGRVSVQEAFIGLPHLEANEKNEPKKYAKGESNYTKLLKDEKFWNLGNNKKTKKVTYHIAPKHRKATLKRFELIDPGENLRDLFFKFPEPEVKRLQEEKILPKKWYIQRNKRLELDKPCKTVTSHCLDELIHPTLNRALTVREVARLQSFPDCYDFIGGPMLCPHIYETQDKYEQIGDAIAPLLAYHWGNKIKAILED